MGYAFLHHQKPCGIALDIRRGGTPTSPRWGGRSAAVLHAAKRRKWRKRWGRARTVVAASHRWGGDGRRAARPGVSISHPAWQLGYCHAGHDHGGLWASKAMIAGGRHSKWNPSTREDTDITWQQHQAAPGSVPETRRGSKPRTRTPIAVAICRGMTPRSRFTCTGDLAQYPSRMRSPGPPRHWDRTTEAIDYAGRLTA